MADSVTVIPIGNAGGIHLPEETLTRLHLRTGDQMILIEEPQGIRLVPYDAEFAAQMQAARQIMQENQEVLKRLAE